MNNALAVIDRIIAEHRQILQKTAGLGRMASDLGAAGTLAAVESSLSGKTGDRRNLLRLQKLLTTTTRELERHFTFEETGLMAAMEKFGDRRVVSGFSTLFFQHEGLRNEFTRSGIELAELIDGEYSGEESERRAGEILSGMNRAIVSLKLHALSEEKLLNELRERLINQG